MKEPLIISSEFEGLNDVIKRVERDPIWLRKVICFMMYYNNPKSGRFTRSSVKRAILDVFHADAYKQRDWIANPHNKQKYPMLTFSEVDLYLAEERFREYDKKAFEVVKKKYKKNFTQEQLLA